MPDLREMLNKAREEDALKRKRKVTKGIRPDRILRGEIKFKENEHANFSGVGASTEIESASSEIENRNPEQSQNKPRTKSEHNPEQTQNKPRTKSEQAPHPKIESQNKLSTQPRTEPRTKSEQTQNKVRTEFSFLELSGLQKKIILFIYEICSASGSRNSGSLSLCHLAESCKTSPGAAQVTTRRLMQKNLLRRSTYKNGRGGWTNYELPEDVYGQVFQLETQNKLRTNPEQTQNKVSTQPSTQPRTNVSSSSSKDLDLKELTNTSDPEALKKLPAPWDEIDFSSLARIRFGEQQIIQLARLNLLNAEQVQESIIAFAFDLAVNNKSSEINGNPLNYFMGILRNGPYAPPANFEAPAVRQMRLYLEAKEREKQVRTDQEKRLEELEFCEWRDGLAAEEICKLVPVTDYAKYGSTGYTVKLKDYFRENIWQERRQNAMNKCSYYLESKNAF